MADFYLLDSLDKYVLIVDHAVSKQTIALQVFF